MDAKETIKAMAFCGVALVVGCGFYGCVYKNLVSKPAAPAAISSAAPAATPSDPCGWQRPSSMTREECERMNGALTDLWLERERERNPNFKPFSGLH